MYSHTTPNQPLNLFCSAPQRMLWILWTSRWPSPSRGFLSSLQRSSDQSWPAAPPTPQTTRYEPPSCSGIRFNVLTDPNTTHNVSCSCVQKSKTHFPTGTNSYILTFILILISWWRHSNSSRWICRFNSGGKLPWPYCSVHCVNIPDISLFS